MLTEAHKVKQFGDENLRRWFSDKHLDLIVWYKPDRKVLGFQLCYKLGHHEKALTWLQDKGFSQDRIDDGEGDIATYKMTPILVPDGAFDKRSILALFKKESEDIDVALRDLVCQKISEYPEAKNN
jgi:hypothetical protein